MTGPEATTPAPTSGDDGVVAGRGSTADYCAYWSDDTTARDGHHLKSHSVPNAKLIRYVERCSFCGWIDGAALDRWAEQAHKEQLTKMAARIALATETEPFAFVQQTDEELTLREVLYQALGAASVCWVGGTGALEFDSSRAKTVAEHLEAEVNRFLGIEYRRGVERGLSGD